MLRKHENTVSVKAGIMAIAVHVVLLVAMLVSFNWKAAHSVMNVTEVELWDKLPAPKNSETPKSELKPIIKEDPKQESRPIVKEQPKPEEPNVDIELEKKKKELELKKEKELEEKLLQKKKLEALQAEAREDELKDKKAEEKKQKEALKKLQQEALSDENAHSDKHASAANAGEIGEYKAKIQAKIRAKVNKTLCGEGSPEIIVDINVLPTGQIGGTPKVTKSSGSDACDEAVERAIIASEPLPLPDDASLKVQFRNLKLKFKPND